MAITGKSHRWTGEKYLTENVSDRREMYSCITHKINLKSSN